MKLSSFAVLFFAVNTFAAENSGVEHVIELLDNFHKQLTAELEADRNFCDNYIGETENAIINAKTAKSDADTARGAAEAAETDAAAKVTDLTTKITKLKKEIADEKLALKKRRDDWKTETEKFHENEENLSAAKFASQNAINAIEAGRHAQPNASFLSVNEEFESTSREALKKLVYMADAL